MDQGNALLDIGSKGSFSINALLSQLGGLSGGGADQVSVFSDLLSQSDTAAAAPAAQTQSAAPASSTDDSSALLQNLDSLSTSLHQAIYDLRQQNNASNPSDKSSAAPAAPQNAPPPTSRTAPQAAASQTSAPADPNMTATAKAQHADKQQAKTNNAATNSGGNQARASDAAAKDTAAATASDATSSTAPAPAAAAATATVTATDTDTATSVDNQSLIAAMTQLLAMIQMVIHNLQPAQTSGGAATTASNSAVDAAPSNGIPDPTTSANPAGDLAAALAALNAGLTATVAATGAQTADDKTKSSDTTTDTGGDPLSQLFDTLQKTLAELTPVVAATAQTTVKQPAAAAAATTTASALSAQLAALETKISGIVATLQQTAASTTNTASTGDNSKLPTQPASNTLSSTAKAPLSDSPQSQIGAFWSGAGAQNAPPAQAQMNAVSAAVVTASAEKNAAGSNSGADSGFSNSDKAGATTMLTVRTDDAAAVNQSGGASTFASQLSSLRAAATAPQQAAIVDQVVLQLSRGVKNGNDQMSLQLHPTDLGKITVKLDFGSDGKVQGTVTAENPQTLEMLQKDSRSLERALQDAGLRADSGSLHFSLDQQSGQNSGQTANGGDSQDGTFSAQGNADDSAALGDLASASTSSETYYITPGGVNIRV